jgi:hypothetical protein
MSLPVADNGNRANSIGLGANWAAIFNDWDIVSNQFVPDTAGDQNIVYWSADVFPDDQWCEITFISGSPDGGPGIAVSGTGLANWKGLYIEAGNGSFADRVVSVINGSINNLGFCDTDAASGDRLRIERIGTTIKVYKNSVLNGTFTDPAPVSGSAGLWNFNNTGVYDDFAAGAVGSASVIPKNALRVLKKARRTRKGKTTQIRAKRQGNQPVRPVKRPLVVKGRRRKPIRSLKTTLIAAKRKGNPAVKPHVSPVIADGRRRKPQRVLKVTQLRAKKAANPAIRPVKRPTIVKGRRRRIRILDVTTLRAKESSTPATANSKSPGILVVKALKKRKRQVKTTLVDGATRASALRAKRTVVLRKKRAARTTSNTQVLAALLAQPAVPRVGAEPVTLVLPKKRRKRQGRTTQLRAKVAGNTAIRPPKSAKIVAGRKRRRRTGDVTLITGARRASVPTVKPSKTLTQVSAKKRKKRVISVKLVTGARRASVPAIKPVKPLTQVGARRKKKRATSVKLITGAKRAANVVRKQTLVQVSTKKRRKRSGDVTQLSSVKRGAIPARRPKKAVLQTTQALNASRRKHQRRTTVLQTARRRKKKSGSLGLKLVVTSSPRLTIARNTSAPRYTVKTIK